MKLTKGHYLYFGLLSVIVLGLLAIFMPTAILQSPLTTPTEYLSTMPYTHLFGTYIIIITPISTFLIYFLGIQTVILGYTFLKNKQYSTHFWWGIAMVFWGIGALLAGTSYQGLGYELKCVGNDYCIHTSWFELYNYHRYCSLLLQMKLV